MDAVQTAERAPSSPDALLASQPHPRGTLAIVLIFALLFTLGWFGVYALVFLERGAPTH